MNDENYVGFENISATTCIKTDKGWEVTNKLVQKRTLDFVTWETEEVKFHSTKDTIEKAYTDTLITMNYFLKKVNGNLFAEDIKEVKEKMIDGVSDTISNILENANDDHLLQ